MPHLDVVEANRQARKGAPLTASRAAPPRRSASAPRGSGSSTTPARRRRRACRKRCPPRAGAHAGPARLSPRLADALPDTAWEDDALQAKIFEVARLTPIEQPLAFKAIYRVLLDKAAGPKAGNLLAFLDRDFLQRRFRELPFDRVEFWKETAITADALRAWHAKEAPKIASQEHRVNVEGAVFSSEYIFTLTDGKRVLRRVVTEGAPAAEGVLA